MRVNLLFGFLGSGKTTLAKHLLAERERDMKTAVIVNEFGEVGIDGDILRGDNVDVVELNSGCMCCTLRGSLALAVDELREKANVERVIVEATGVAQPGELLDTLVDAAGGGVDVGPLVTVVDAFKFPKLLAMLGPFYVDQIQNADIVIVNKIDLVSTEQLKEVTRQLREVNAEADFIFAEHGRVRPGELFTKRAQGIIDRHLLEGEGDGSDHVHDEHEHHEHHHEGDHDPHAGAPMQSFVVRGTGHATSRGLRSFFGSLPDSVWRAKGFVRVDGVASLVQYSLGQLEIEPAQEKGAEAMVFIGSTDMDRAQIEAAYAKAGAA